MLVEIEGKGRGVVSTRNFNFSVSILESVSQKKLRGERLPFLKTLMLAVTLSFE